MKYFKYTKQIIKLSALMLLLLVSSCQSRVLSPDQTLQNNTLDLYKTYTIQTKDAQKHKVQVLKVDPSKIYGKNKAGETVEILREDVRVITKTDYLAFTAVALAAIAAVIFIPI